MLPEKLGWQGFPCGTLGVESAWGKVSRARSKTSLALEPRPVGKSWWAQEEFFHGSENKVWLPHSVTLGLFYVQQQLKETGDADTGSLCVCHTELRFAIYCGLLRFAILTSWALNRNQDKSLSALVSPELLYSPLPPRGGIRTGL